MTNLRTSDLVVAVAAELGLTKAAPANTPPKLVVGLDWDDAVTAANDKEFRQFLAGGLGPPSPSPKTFVMQFGPTDGVFDYPGGSFDPGERPTDIIDKLTISYQRDGALIPLATLSGFSLTHSQIEGMTTEAEFYALFYSGSDQIFGADADDLITPISGNDVVYAGGGSDRIFGGSGNDRLNGDTGHDTLFGESGHDSLFGGDGNDTEDGGSGNDLVHGGNGNDVLKGGLGNDRINGGFGRDTLTGGSGKDLFVYQTLSKFNGKESGLSTSTRDVITDFKHGQDKIDIGFILVPKFKFLGDDPLTGLGQVHYKYVGSNTVVEVSTDRDAAPELSLLLKGHITLTAGDFIL